MPRTALVADDSRGVRQVLARHLTGLGWTAIEAADGGETLDMLDGNDVDLAVIDINMPVLDGLEILSAVRRSARYAELPVVVVSGGADASTAAEFIKLGVSDFLVKPLTGELLRTRLGRLQSMSESAVRVRRPTTTSASAGHGIVLIVDGDAQYREFVTKVLGPHYPTADVSSGITALRACDSLRPSAVVVGSDIGLLTPELLAKKLRSKPGCVDTRFVLVTGKDVPAGHSFEEDGFDATITRTFVPKEFEHQFRCAMTASFSDSDTLLGIRKTIESATVQALGMMASVDIDISTLVPEAALECELQAWTDIKIQTEDLPIRMTLRATQASASVVGAQLLGLDAADVGLEDGLSALGELVNVIAGRVKASVVGQGGSGSFTIPTLCQPGQAPPPWQPEILLHFKPSDDSFGLVVEIGLVEDSTSAAG